MRVGLCLVFVLLCNTKCPFYFCNHLAEEERAGCFALIAYFDVMLLLVLCVPASSRCLGLVRSV